jgi:acyl-CoA thioesterase FadM
MFKEIRQFERIDFTATIPFRITDHNYGDHVANNAFVEYLHEGRVQLLGSMGYTERNLEGAALILSELSVKYTKQGFYPDVLRLEMSIANIRPTRFDIYYRGYDSVGDLLVLAKTEMAAFDVEAFKPTRLPDAFRSRFLK